jgi:hypothetical protein
VFPKTSFRLTVSEDGAPGEIRTPDPHIRSVMLYPAELQARQSELTGAPGENRTPNLLVRSQTLYPIELRAHTFIVPNPTDVFRQDLDSVM